jgi:hypothetical protein
MAENEKEARPAAGESESSREARENAPGHPDPGESLQDPQVHGDREDPADRDSPENQEARTGDDPMLRGHSLQDHDRVRAEMDAQTGNRDDDVTGTAVRSNPDLVPGRRDEALEDVRRVRAENERRTRERSTVMIEEQVAASTTSGSAKHVDVSTADGLCRLNTHGEAVLDQDGVADLQRKLAKAFQAVS